MLIKSQQFVDPNSASGRELKKIKRSGQLIEIEDLNITVKVSSKWGSSIMTEACPECPGLDLIVSDSPRVKLYLRSSYKDKEEALETLKRDFIERS